MVRGLSRQLTGRAEQVAPCQHERSTVLTMESTVIHPRIPSDLLKRLDEWATRTRRSRNAAVLIAIEQLVDGPTHNGDPVSTASRRTLDALEARRATREATPIPKGRTR